MALDASGGQQQRQRQRQESQSPQQEQSLHQRTTKKEAEGDLPSAPSTAAPLPTRSLAALSMALPMGDGGYPGDENEALARALAGYCSVSGGSSSCTSDAVVDGEREGEGGGEGSGELLPPQRIQQQQDEAVAHLNAVLLAVQRRRRLEEVVGAMGPYLTSEDGRVSP